MSVEAKHPDYSKWVDRWKRCRDAAAGEDEIKDKGVVYLPKPSGQTANEYDSYRQRAYWFNATQRTADGLQGLIKRKEPVVTVPDAMADWLDDVTMSGISFQDFASQVIDEMVKIGRAGVLVDYPNTDPAAPLTRMQEEDLGARPFLALYEAEDIINWRTSKVGARTELSMIVLREHYEIEDPTDEFKPKAGTQYRVLDIVEGIYRQRVFRQITEGSGTSWAVVDGSEMFPRMAGAPMDCIPFFFLGISRKDGKIEKPPIYDLANVNLSHYRTMADLENGAHWSGVPTPVITGVSDDKKEIALGSTAAIVLADPNAKAFFLELQGTFQALEKRAEVKETEMALLGARIIAPDRKATETAETAAIHRSGENSVLASIAITIGSVLTDALEMMAEWGGIANAECSVALNTDFLAMQMSPAMLVALTSAVQAGKLTMQDYFSFLQRGDVIDSDRTFEESMADLEAADPMGGGGSVALPAPAASGGGRGGSQLE